MEHSKLPLTKWLLAIYLISQAKTGLSALAMKRQLGVSCLPHRVAAASQDQQASAGRTLPVADGLMAAAALQHDLTLITRNTKDFAGLGLSLVNPWKE